MFLCQMVGHFVKKRTNKVLIGIKRSIIKHKDSIMGFWLLALWITEVGIEHTSAQW